MPGIHSEDSEFVNHEPCPSCGSRDNAARYTDGHLYCFGCEYYEKGDGEVVESKKRVQPGLIEFEYSPLTKRGITEETCRKFGYGVGHHYDRPVQVANYRNRDGEVVAQKLRTASKDFSILGDGRSLDLWGMHLWGSGKMLVITEGEIDAMSVSQAQNNKWPVCSIPSGAAAAAKVIRKNIEYLGNFDTVVFMFDQDDPGQKAAAECASVLPPGTAKIASLPLKDPNEMLVAGRSKDIISAIWNAKAYRPDGVVPGEEVWERVANDDEKDSVLYPWHGLNLKTYGMRKGEVVTLTSGTGQGKSSVIRNWEKWLLDQGHTVGIVALEENVAQTAKSLMGISMGIPHHLWKDQGVTEDQKRQAFDATVGNGRCVLYDHFGSMESDNLLSRIRYMAVAMGCTHIFLDHLSIVISGIGGGDERRLLDNTMTKLRSLVEELQISLIVVSHLKRPEGRSHEEGGQVSLSHLRGSGAIAQLSDICIALERDQQDESRKNITTLRVLKNRYTGDTGVACSVSYNPETGLLSEYDDVENVEVPF